MSPLGWITLTSLNLLNVTTAPSLGQILNWSIRPNLVYDQIAAKAMTFPLASAVFGIFQSFWLLRCPAANKRRLLEKQHAQLTLTLEKPTVVRSSCVCLCPLVSQADAEPAGWFNGCWFYLEPENTRRATCSFLTIDALSDVRQTSCSHKLLCQSDETKSSKVLNTSFTRCDSTDVSDGFNSFTTQTLY